MTTVSRNILRISYVRIPEDIPARTFEIYSRLLPHELRIACNRYQRLGDQVRYLAGKMLLARSLGKMGGGSDPLKLLQYTEFGRPFIPQGLDFNISHSGEYVLCAVSDSLRVGVDIEKVHSVDFDDFSTVMRESEWRAIRSSDHPLETFFQYWAIKESVMKADGRGFSLSPLNIFIEDGLARCEGRQWFLQKIKVHEDYRACVAVDAADYNLNVVQEEFMELNP